MEDLVASATPLDWSGKRVFITGHTGFKGGWLALWLSHLGAEVRGFSLDPDTRPNLFTTARIDSRLDDIRGDIRSAAQLTQALHHFQPEVVFHLAAQPLVRRSYAEPALTFETNVMGTVHLLDAIRTAPSVRAVVCVTTDKCYENREWQWGYRERDPLGGYDPYSSSKACAELVASAFRHSYFPTQHSTGQIPAHRVALATARAGNVIGGGDWSPDRLIPDLVRGFETGTPVPIRHPYAVRPWQHVLEPLHGYLLLAEKLLSPEPAHFASAYNFGPAEQDERPVAWVADHMVKLWGDGAAWFHDEAAGFHETATLKLDATRARTDLGWKPQLRLGHALDLSVAWYRAHAAGADMQAFTLEQIAAYIAAPTSDAPVSGPAKTN